MKIHHKLQIDFEPSLDTYIKITDLLNVNPVNSDEGTASNVPFNWIYEVVDEGNDSYFDFINNFLDILENKYDELAKLGIERGNITFWLFYEYDEQCNLEFDPISLKRIGDNGIKLCITCWASGNEYNMEDKSSELKS